MSKEIDTIIDRYAKEGYVITREYAEAISKSADLIDATIDLYAKEGYVITREYAEAISKSVESAHQEWVKNKSEK